MIRRWIFYPFLLAIYPILALFAQNVREVGYPDLLGPVLLALAAAIGCWALLKAILKDAARAGLATSVCILLFYLTGRGSPPVNLLLAYISRFWVWTEFNLTSNRVVLGEVILSLPLFCLIAKARRAAALTGPLNLFAIALVLLPTAQAVRLRPPTAMASGPAGGPLLTTSPAHHRPDIYYIVLDSYARADILRDYFALDNRPFIEGLERRGFYVAGASTSNYCQTPLSLSSSLNADYLDSLADRSDIDVLALKGVVGKNRLIQTLAPLGYMFRTFSSGFDCSEHPEWGGYHSPFPRWKDFHRLLLDVTPVSVLLPESMGRDHFSEARERTLYALDHLADVAEDPSPTFTFAHIMCPHPPFIFDAEGRDISDRDRLFYQNDGDRLAGLAMDPEVYRKGYRDQTVFVTGRIERLIDRIVERSPEPPVIILQGDHGSGLRLNMVSKEDTDHHERMGILNAYLFPGRRYEALYPEISPVNSFRVVLNTFFGGRLDLRPDRNYYSTWAYPFGFEDVTREAHAGPAAMPDAPALAQPGPGRLSGSGSKRSQEGDQIGQLALGQDHAPGMPLVAEEFLQRAGPAVVEEQVPPPHVTE